MAIAQSLAQEVSDILQSEHRQELLKNMYGNQPVCWHDDLQGVERWRCIINFFTRMRFLTLDGCLELNEKNHPDGNNTLLPWFTFPQRAMADQDIIFGHWAALEGITKTEHVFALDTGCVWGKYLTALHLESGKLSRVTARAKSFAHR